MHNDKRRDMARSVLASTQRRAARCALVAVRRRHRRAVGQQLRSLRGRLDFFALDDFDLGDEDRYPDHLVQQEVTARRGFDKLGPLFRWSVRSTRTVRVEDRLSHLRASLPANLVGWHAMTHLETVSELVPDTPDQWFTDPSRRLAGVEQKEALGATLRWVLATGRQTAFNRFVKRGGVPPLLGVDAIGGFTTSVLGSELVWIPPLGDEPGRHAPVALLPVLDALRRIGLPPSHERGLAEEVPGWARRTRGRLEPLEPFYLQELDGGAPVCWRSVPPAERPGTGAPPRPRKR